MYERYCRLRDSLGLRDADVAKGTNITKSTFSEWKQGKSLPNADKLLRISGFLNTTVEYLMTGKEPSLSDKILKNPEVLELSEELVKNSALRKLVLLEKDLSEEDIAAVRVMVAALIKKRS
ncbi:MAG: helix-turn-helix transcriptional regulator [Lachnospiraceae bacterium]|nr:helix-turn-helix transcriptional regulator [Lachnospiraceae bacterium]